jgi:hypothetical protein
MGQPPPQALACGAPNVIAANVRAATHDILTNFFIFQPSFKFLSSSSLLDLFDSLTIQYGTAFRILHGVTGQASWRIGRAEFDLRTETKKIKKRR